MTSNHQPQHQHQYQQPPQQPPPFPADYALHCVHALASALKLKKQDREDIEQSALMSMIRRWQRYNPSMSSPRTYCDRLARWEVRRAASRRPVYDANDGSAIADTLASPSTSLSIDDGINGLPPPLDRLAEMRLAGYTWQDCRRRLGMTAAELRESRGRLRELLREK